MQRNEKMSLDDKINDLDQHGDLIYSETKAGKNTNQRVGLLGKKVAEILQVFWEDFPKMFLRKDVEDSAEECITFKKGLISESDSIFESGLTSEDLSKFNAGLESAFVLVENEATQGVVQGLTEVDNTPSTSRLITQSFTESMRSTGGAESLGDLTNVDESFDTVPDAVYSFRKQNGIFYPTLGGGSTSARLTLTYVTPATVTVSLEMPFEIEYMFTSLMDGKSTGVGSVTYRVNNRIVGGETIQQGGNVFNAKRHLVIGDNNIVISVTDSYGNTRTLSYRITAVKVELTSTFNANQIFDSSVMFRFIPIGFGSMTITISVDGIYHGKVVTTQSNRQLTYNIPKLSHGSHIIEAIMTIESNDGTITSNKLEYSIISIVAGDNTVIISSIFTTAEATQFDTVVIPFTVYNPLLVNTDIDMLVNGLVIQNRVVDRTQQHWSFNLTESGSITLQINAGSVSKFFYVDVAESNIADLEETEGLQLKLISKGRNNAESNKDSWEYIDIKSSFSNFNWTSDGWTMDSNGSSYLKVSGDAKLEIPFKIFDTDFKLSGKTIEVEFFTEDVSNLDYVVLSCMQGDKGFEVTSRKATFKSEQSTITTQFKENELIKVSISVEQSAKDRLLSLFINGVLSGVLQYPISDNFIQAKPTNIVAQGAEATIGIYAIRVYNTDLKPWQILNNYIFDYPVARERELIYMRNNILGAGGDISYSRLVEHLPCLIITGELPNYKGDKKTSDVEFEDRQNPARSFTATNVQNDVQGTSSQYYPRKNYKMKFKSGFNMSDGSYAKGFQTHEDTLPATVFTHKADFAESSGTHNTGLAKVIEGLLRTLNIKTPAQLTNDKVRTTVDGFAMAIFQRYNPEDTPVFIGKYNFNTDKAAENTFGFDTPVECWEVRNNTSRRVLFKESDYVGDDWLNDFEGRFPEDNTNPINLKRMTDWVVSCIGNPTKFRTELSQYFHQDFLLSYSVLTELFGMVDQRAKNLFWTTFDTRIWMPIFYDNDTALGINNEGVNAFYFDIEVHDKIGTQDVWNGSDSELWKLVEQAFPNELMAMYQRIRSNNTLSYDSVLSILNGEHSDKWSETVYNEDSQFKYIDPLLVDGNGSFLYAAQGSRGEHRKWWLYNRFRYMDSKYNTGDFKSDYITMRLYTPSGSLAVQPNADFTITTFGSQYIRAKWGSYETSQRVKLGEEVTFDSPDITFNDTETILYGASYLKTIGDLSGKYAGTVDVSKGTQLTEVIIGNSMPGYINTNLHILNVGNNKLLRKINIENCPSLTQAIDLSGCIGLEQVYARGSGITGVSLSIGGTISILSLPATLINLTIIGQPIRQTGLQLEGYAKLSSLHIDKCPNLDSYSLVKDILSKANALQNIRLIDIDATDTNLDTLVALASMRGIDDNGFVVAKAVISGKFYTQTVDSEAYNEIKTLLPYLTITYGTIVVPPTRTVIVRRAQNSAAHADTPIKINDTEYVTDVSGKVVLKTSQAIKVYVELSGYVTKTEIFASTSANATHYVQMVNYVTGTISIVGKNGFPLSGAAVTLQGSSGITSGGLITFDGLFYASSVPLKIVYKGQTYTENINIGYVNYSKTVTLPVDEIPSMEPIPNGNIQLLVDVSTKNNVAIWTSGWDNQNATIDWGDGSLPEVITMGQQKHIYGSGLKLCQIEISNSNNLTSFQFRSTSGGYGELVAFWTIGNSSVKNIFTMTSDSPQASVIHLGDDIFKNDSGRTSWNSVFYGMVKLSKLPSTFNKYTLSSATNMSQAFINCSSLTSIPIGLFDNCVNVTTFSNCFRNCQSLTSIPIGLFDNCVNVTTFSNCFNNCPSLTSIPIGLFDNCVNVTVFEFCFMNCSSLTSIPIGLFDNCGNATTFSSCFRNCQSLIYGEIPQLKLNADKAFYLSGASYLTVLVSRSLTPPTIVTSSIPNNTSLKIYVPDASVSAYKSATNWSVYTTKIYPLSEYENN